MVAPTRWVDRALVLGAWAAVEAALRLGVSLPRLATICKVSLVQGTSGSPGSGPRAGTAAEGPTTAGSAVERAAAAGTAAAESDAQGRVAALSAAERRRLGVTQVLAARWPFGPGPCLRLSLVAGYVLRRHRPCLVLGVTGAADGGFAAHAWLELADGRSFGFAPGYLPLGRSPES